MKIHGLLYLCEVFRELFIPQVQPVDHLYVSSMPAQTVWSEVHVGLCGRYTHVALASDVLYETYPDKDITQNLTTNLYP